MNNIYPLSELKTGETALIQELCGGYSFRSRLAALGFTPGAEIKMVQNLGHGPLIVSLRDTRIALGRGEAQKILIRLEKEPLCHSQVKSENASA
ncbi:MAG: ferrous iron transport protein A [Chloroflexi bacterium]|nr:ferrous iron transport protein A [Chloroflexota bacterium]